VVIRRYLPALFCFNAMVVQESNATDLINLLAGTYLSAKLAIQDGAQTLTSTKKFG